MNIHQHEIFTYIHLSNLLHKYNLALLAGGDGAIVASLDHTKAVILYLRQPASVDRVATYTHV